MIEDNFRAMCELAQKHGVKVVLGLLTGDWGLGTGSWGLGARESLNYEI
jgi:hypothetical protein